jgi:hypothetical protein
MDSAKINDWLQVIGIFGVIASLVFVGLQMRQTQEIAIAQAHTACAALSMESSNAVVGSSPAALSGMAKIYAEEYEQLNREEYVAVEYIFSANLTNIENNHYQYQAGFLPESHWHKNLRDLQCWLEHPLFQGMQDDGFYFRTNFREVIDDAIESATNSPSNCWDWDVGSAIFFPKH